MVTIEERIYNYVKRLPIVFCLDVSKSMRQGSSSHISSLNALCKKLIGRLKNDDPQISNAAHVSFVTSGIDIHEPIGFQWVRSLGERDIVATLRLGIEKIKWHRELLEAAEIPYYMPWIIVITERSTAVYDDSQEFARLREELDRCCSVNAVGGDVIFPLYVRVGDAVDVRTLAEIGSDITINFDIGSVEESVSIIARQIYRMIRESVVGGKSLGQSHLEIITHIMKDTKRILEELEVGGFAPSTLDIKYIERDMRRLLRELSGKEPE